MFRPEIADFIIPTRFDLASFNNTVYKITRLFQKTAKFTRKLLFWKNIEWNKFEKSRFSQKLGSGHSWLPGGLPERTTGGQKNFGPGRAGLKKITRAGPGQKKIARAGLKNFCSGRAGLKNFCSGRAGRAEKMCSGKRQNKKNMQ